jgi:hypothetical protein
MKHGRQAIWVLLVGLLAATPAFIACKSSTAKNEAADQKSAADKEKAAQVVEKYRAETDAKIAAILDIARKTEPPLTADHVSYAGPPLRLSANFVVLEASAIDKLSAFDRDAWGGMYRGTYESAGEAVHTLKTSGQFFYTAETAEKDIKNLLALQTVVMVKRVAGQDPVESNGTLTTPGSYRGEAHLYDVSGKYLGGVRFAATNSEKISFYYDKKRDDEDRKAQSAALGDLRKNMRDAIDAALTPFVGHIIW